MASLRSLQPEAREVAQAFVRFLQANGVTVTVTSTRRSIAEQTRLWNRYKAGLSKYPAAPPGRSLHGVGIAFDLHLDPPLYEAAGKAWERAGYTWGGRFNDEIHFDLRPHHG